ncbi:MAG: T9SS type A sorting domain-containing protein [Ignavibacteriae bacterium]|nr:T9SS C-terminal target domain-containing protein [Ignavibacteriota bacterium]NOG98119.1 T9SS type A sorting domain-containing protein [Ignavibacteriota bacterium]
MSNTQKLVALILLLIQPAIFSQTLSHNYFEKNREVYFKIELNDKSRLAELSRIISIDNFAAGEVYAYANENEFRNFSKLNLEYQILPHPGDVENVQMSDDLKSIEDWNVYPTYDAYVNMMYQFQSAYPNICRIESIGATVEGRELLFAVISDNINQREAEPQFMYSSTMHGDETTGYVLMLRLIDSLLTSYNSDTRITNLINNVEIWINPNANPDGTYRSGNHTVSGATRYNANSVNLNRNFPDPDDGPHPDGNAWQPETIAMMNLASAQHFVLSANFHGGAEVVNYPWDTWSDLHPDDNWFKYISRQYADTVHTFAPSNYMTGFDNGITNGYQWYTISGGRQDYFTYYHGCREVTIEISDSKLLSASLLPAHWEYNKNSLLNYIEQCTFGLRGIVSNTTGDFLKAKITILNHDFNNSEIYSDSSNGGYYRMIEPGNYTIVFEADSHETKTIENIQIENGTVYNLDVVLTPDYIVPVELVSFSADLNESKVSIKWATATETNNYGFEVERKLDNSEFEKIKFIEGAGTTAGPQNYFYEDHLNGIISDEIIYRLKQIDFSGDVNFSNEVLINNLTPNDFELSQNYPNPFNPATKIKFSTPPQPSPYQGEGVKERFITLTIYDILGNEITVLVNEQKHPGSYEVIWNAEDQTSGVYICKLAAGSISKSIKMILLR